MSFAAFLKRFCFTILFFVLILIGIDNAHIAQVQAISPPVSISTTDTGDFSQSITVFDLVREEAAASAPGFGSTPIQPGPFILGTTTLNTPVTNDLIVFETGDVTLTVSNPSFGGANASEFDLVTPFTSFDIADGDSSVGITIRCTPTAEGLRTATFTINTNDPTYPAVSFQLECYGYAVATAGFGSTPQVPGPLDFGQVEAGNGTSRNLKIFENGNQTLNFGNASLSGSHPSDFTFNAFPTSISDGGAAVNIPITCTPSDIGLRSATLSMTTNDPAKPTVSWNLVCQGTPPPSPLLESVGQSITSPVNVINGMYGVAASPDGNHVYATAFNDDQVLVFARNTNSGNLSYLMAISNMGINGPMIVAVSPDGQQVYVASTLANSLVVFNRNTENGFLSTKDILTSSVLTGAYGVTVSPDGRFIYVTSQINSNIVGYERLENGDLAYRSANSVFSHADLIQPRNLVISPDGNHLYVTADPSSSADEGNLLVYSIDPSTGAITHEQTIHEGDLYGGPIFFGIINGLGGAFDVVVSPDGADVYVIGTYDGAIVHFSRDSVTGQLTYNSSLRDGQGDVDGLTGVSGIDITSDGSYVVTTAYNDDAVAVFLRNQESGRLTQVQIVPRGGTPDFYPRLGGARDIDISPDGDSVYAAAFDDNAVVHLHTINPVPVVEMLTPASATVSSSGMTVSITGQDFIPGVTAVVNGISRSATYLNPTTLEVDLSAADLSAVGTLSISAANPTPGGGTAAQALPFTVSAQDDHPVPSIEALLPGGVAAGGNQDVTITIQGSNFVSSSIARWNGADRSTTFIDNSTLEITIPGNELSAVGTAVVTVYNPTPGGGTSNLVGFSISYPWQNPVPTILSVDPDEITQIGSVGQDVDISIQGIDFIEDSQARWNGEDRATQFISETELTMTITAADMTQGGIGVVTVYNPAPSGGTSNGITVELTLYPHGIYLPVIKH